MRRLAPAVLLMIGCACPAVAGASGGGRVQLDLSVKFGGYVSPSEGSPASAHWISDFVEPNLDDRRNHDGLAPGRLAEAAMQPLETEDPDSECNTTTRLLGIADPAARFQFGIVVDAAHGRGTVLVKFDSAGTVQLETRYVCPYEPLPDYDRVDSVLSVMGSGWGDKPWPIHRVSRQLWTADMNRTETSEETNPTVSSIKLRLSGTPRAFNALCVKPTARQMRTARTERQALRILHRYGLRRESGLSLVRSGRVPKGHWFVPSQEEYPWERCGEQVVVAQSSGPSGATI